MSADPPSADPQMKPTRWGKLKRDVKCREK